MKVIIYLLLTILVSCGLKEDPNDLGLVDQLPKGEYLIENYGSRHIVKCLKPNGEYYWVNDTNFGKSKIPGYDAHQYQEKTKIIIK